MKRFLYPILAVLFITVNACLVSCNSYVEKSNQVQELRDSLRKKNQVRPKYSYDMQNVEFDGHLYVVYTEKNGYGFGAAMVHSPNCKCSR